jgi:hypothetical protein
VPIQVNNYGTSQHDTGIKKTRVGSNLNPVQDSEKLLSPISKILRPYPQSWQNYRHPLMKTRISVENHGSTGTEDFDNGSHKQSDER